MIWLTGQLWPVDCKWPCGWSRRTTHSSNCLLLKWAVTAVCHRDTRCLDQGAENPYWVNSSSDFCILVVERFPLPHSGSASPCPTQSWIYSTVPHCREAVAGYFPRGRLLPFGFGEIYSRTAVAAPNEGKRDPVRSREIQRRICPRGRHLYYSSVNAKTVV